MRTKTIKLKLLNDFVIKKIIGTKGQEKALEGFINAVLADNGKEPIKDPVILNDVALTKENINGKLGILDILAKSMDDKYLINIEIQLQETDDMINRSGFYHSKLRSGVEALKAGESYRQLPKVVAINLLDYEDKRLHPEEYHTRIINVDAKHHELVFDFSEHHFLELPKFRRFKDKDMDNPLHRWLMYLDPNCSEARKEELVNMDPSIRVAEQAAQKIMATPEELELYRLREKYERDQASSAIYLEEKAIKKVARSFKEDGISYEIIAKNTGLSIEEIEKL